EFTRPANFNLATYWEQSKLQFVESLPSFKVEVLADPTIISRMTFTDKFIEKVATGRQRNHCNAPVPVTLNFNTEQEAIAYILGFGGAMKVVQPEYLIEKVVREAKLVMDMYANEAQT